MTLKEAVQVFDRVQPVDSCWLTIDGEQVGVPYCCNLPVVENSQNGIPRLYCIICGRTIRQIGRQWIITKWGEKGIKLPAAVAWP